MYEGESTRVKSLWRDYEDFCVRVRVHHGSTFSLYLFSLIRHEVTKDIQGEVSGCMLFADDIVLIGENLKGINGWLEEWREALKSKGLKISRSKMD